LDKQQNLLYKGRRHIIFAPVNSLWWILKLAYLRKKYKQHSFEKSFDFDWKKTNFNRIALVNFLVAKTSDCSYLEIGCDTNDLFDAVPIFRKTGVDPQIGGNIRKTSDEFFKANDSFFDVIFIDGLHTYEQVRKDVINSIRFLKPGGWIALHDMLPRSWLEDHVPNLSTSEWTGDVWKVAFELSQTEGIEFKIIKIDRGVGVIRINKNNPSLVDLRNELNDKQFSYFYENVNKLPLVEWSDCQDWLERS